MLDGANCRGEAQSAALYKFPYVGQRERRLNPYNPNGSVRRASS